MTRKEEYAWLSEKLDWGMAIAGVLAVFNIVLMLKNNTAIPYVFYCIAFVIAAMIFGINASHYWVKYLKEVDD